MIDTTSTINAARNLQLVMRASERTLVIVLACVLLAGVIDVVGFGSKLALFGDYPEADLRTWQSWALVLLVCIHLCLWIKLLRTAGTLFRQIAQETPAFASRSAQIMAHVLWGLLVWGLLSQILASLAVTWHFPQGQRSIGIGFGTPQLTVIFAALIAGFMAKAFALGAALWKDHKEVV